MKPPKCTMLKEGDKRAVADIPEAAVNESLADALAQLRDEEKSLIQLGAHERSVCFRLAFYLQHLFPDFDVDCEYNRYYLDPKNHKSLRLKIRLLEEARKYISAARKRGLRPEDEILVSVYPDVIVHRRDTPDNLMIIEAKRNYGGMFDTYDRLKLSAYKEQLHYRYARLVTFDVAYTPDPYTVVPL